MDITILFFGATADASGTRKLELSLDEAADVNGAVAEVVTRFPKLNGRKLLFSKNQEYARGDEAVASGDELAIFTPVSGG